MKTFTLLAFLFFSAFSFSQSEDTTAVEVADTVEIYVINKTNRFVAYPNEGNTKYAFFYRDLNTLKAVIEELKFENAEQVDSFFDTCEKALETDKTYITQGYNVSRNRLSKNVLRLNNKDGGYCLLSYDTLEKMRKAFDKYTGKE